MLTFPSTPSLHHYVPFLCKLKHLGIGNFPLLFRKMSESTNDSRPDRTGLVRVELAAKAPMAPAFAGQRTLPTPLFPNSTTLKMSMLLVGCAAISKRTHQTEQTTTRECRAYPPSHPPNHPHFKRTKQFRRGGGRHSEDSTRSAQKVKSSLPRRTRFEVKPTWEEARSKIQRWTGPRSGAEARRGSTMPATAGARTATRTVARSLSRRPNHGHTQATSRYVCAAHCVRRPADTEPFLTPTRHRKMKTASARWSALWLTGRARQM